MSRVKVLSIVGPGRSGTTLLAGLVGEVPGWGSVGELRWLWQRGIIEGRPCGCGRPLLECRLWATVLDGVAQGCPERAAEIVTAQRHVSARRRRLRTIQVAARGSAPSPALELLRSHTGRLVPAVADVAAVRGIVDSSKRAHDAAILAGLDGVDHYVVHMVRDPGAVAFSWQRTTKTVRTASAARPMATRGLTRSAIRWIENCVGAEVLRREIPADRWLFVRYEDFVTAPRDTVSAVLAFLGEEGAAPFLDDHTVTLGVQHTVAGNPNRFRSGEVAITPDDEWRRGLPLPQKIAVRLLAWPWLLRYGYPLWD